MASKLNAVVFGWKYRRNKGSEKKNKKGRFQRSLKIPEAEQRSHSFVLVRRPDFKSIGLSAGRWAGVSRRGVAAYVACGI